MDISAFIKATVLATALIMLPSQASEQSPHTFVIGVEAVHYFPLYDFDYQTPDKPSFTRDLLAGFFDSKGYAYRFLPLPIKRFNRWYIEQNIDFKFPDNFRWRAGEKNKLNITYSEPVILLTAGAFVLKKNEQGTRKQIKKLGTVTGFYPTLWVDRVNSGETEIIESDGINSVVKHLIYENVDAINIDPNVIAHTLTLLNDESKIVLNKKIHHEKYAYHFSSIQYPQVIAEFNQYLRDNTQLIKQLKQKYKIRED